MGEAPGYLISAASVYERRQIIRRSYTAATVLVRHGRGLVAAFQDGIVQIRRMRFARVEGHDNPRSIRIDFYIADSLNIQKGLAELSRAFITILAFRRDFDRLQNRMIGALVKKRTAR